MVFDNSNHLLLFYYHLLLLLLVSLRENPVIPSLSQELELVHDEYSKQLHIRKLREALCNLTLGNTNTNTNNSINHIT